jgi:hypothetical protein
MELALGRSIDKPLKCSVRSMGIEDYWKEILKAVILLQILTTGFSIIIRVRASKQNGFLHHERPWAVLPKTAHFL